eukprot:CAMPEP_0183582294 /NCGR_PEP_ID=MMETSP0371-20130417/149392_1 /TAXON_ID=268820 /ORGANISM="Peridinium aciculiferum, Strain PAER-2" /LENGTH=201 /DNA_ID=CAMNT_0025793023 /DNA_START=1 /DNA_END=603 /DNA_ORIENTATION=+
MPISKAEEMAHLKMLVSPRQPGEDAEPEPARRNPDRKGGGKGKVPERKKQEVQGAGRVEPNMGSTEILPGSQRNDWWKNCEANALAVIVREHFSLTSAELWRVPPGHYVQQAGPNEVFVSGQATGLQRMPVLPRGWVTVDAISVGGPQYLEKVRRPAWRVIFQSGTARGDIVVRDSLPLDSPEVAVLFKGAHVEQAGPQHV